MTETNNLFIWGSSPQVLRLAIQARKRAKASQKMEETLKNELNRRSEPGAGTEIISPTDNGLKHSKVEDESIISVAKKTEIPKINEMTEDITEKTVNAETSPTIKITPAASVIPAEDESNKMEEGEEVKMPISEEVIEENKDHLLPVLVETGLVNGKIVQISTGLYHFALITNESKLYTWGKNLERQLGRKGPRSDCPHPLEVDTIEEAMNVECGADFTIVMTKDYSIKAFGNTNNGQCGKEIQMDKSGIPSKMMRLRMTKRFVRIPEGSQCIEVPIDINLNIHNMNQKNYSTNEPIKFVKKLPKFNQSFIIDHDLVLLESLRMNQLQERDNTEFGQKICSNINNNGNDDHVMENAGQSENMFSMPLTPLPSEMTTSSGELKLNEYKSHNDFIHYCLYIFHGLYDQNFIETLPSNEELVQHKFNEYHLRLLMLNYNYLEAFKLILRIEQDEYYKVNMPVDTNTDQLSKNLIKIFEYFTYDNINIVPMHQDDIKYFIHEIFHHFISNNLNKSLLEEFFLVNLDYYLLQLGYLLYFHFNNPKKFNNNNYDQMNTNCNSNNNSIQNDVDDKVFDRQLREKFSSLYSEEDNDLNKLTNLTQVQTIFDNVSTKFNLVICEKLMKYVARYDD